MATLRSLYKKRKFIKTKEDWYPSFLPDVDPSFECQMIELGSDAAVYGWRVLCRGADDFVLEKDFKPDEFMFAHYLYEEVKDFITQADLKELYGLKPG